MNTEMRHTKLRAVRLTVIALASLAASRADVIQTTVELPPASGAYDFGGVCLSALGRCTDNAIVSGFHVLTRTIINGNEVVAADATYSADVFTDNGGVPGAFLGHLNMAGTVEFTYVGRDPSVNPLGSFATELTAFDFQGMLRGNTFEVKKDPGKVSGGDTTIVETNIGPPVTYDVSGSLDILALYSFNGGPLTEAPPRTATVIPSLQPVPEPASGALAGALMAAMACVASRRRIRMWGSRTRRTMVLLWAVLAP